jgi:hypothetical protein
MANLFVLAVVGGNHIFGKVTQEQYDSWLATAAKLVIKNPALAIIQPVHDPRTKQLVGYNMSLGPVFPEKTRQESVALDATLVEVLSPIETDEVSGNEYCREQGEMFMNYLGWLDQWRAEMSGIIMPGKQKIITGGNEPIPLKR